jgi:hypothetical protein
MSQPLWPDLWCDIQAMLPRDRQAVLDQLGMQPKPSERERTVGGYIVSDAFAREVAAKIRSALV